MKLGDKLLIAWLLQAVGTGNLTDLRLAAEIQDVYRLDEVNGNFSPKDMERVDESGSTTMSTAASNWIKDHLQKMLDAGRVPLIYARYAIERMELYQV